MKFSMKVPYEKAKLRTYKVLFQFSSKMAAVNLKIVTAVLECFRVQSKRSVLLKNFTPHRTKLSLYNLQSFTAVKSGCKCISVKCQLYRVR